MAFPMHPVTSKVRVGVDKNSRLHVETWPMDHGWTRDMDPALSSGDPQTTILEPETIGGIKKFLNKNDKEFSKLVCALSDIVDLWMDDDAAEDDYSDGYSDALSETGRIAQAALTAE